jgi:hypothetical protein
MFLVALTALLCFSGCATAPLTPQQAISAGVSGAGEAIGTAALNKHIVNGQVDPAYLAGYETTVTNLRGYMQGQFTPADMHTFLANANGAGLSQPQVSIVAFIDGLSPEFIAVNGGAAPTPDGAIADAAVKQLSVGAARAVGLVTGTNWNPPWLTP